MHRNAGKAPTSRMAVKKSSKKTSAKKASAKKGKARSATPRAVTVTGSQRPAKNGAIRIKDADPAAPVEVTITLRGPDLPAPTPGARVANLADFESRYGASKEDADKVKDVLGQHGIATKEISLPTRSMIVTGSVAQMEEVFHPDLGIYEDDEQGQFRDRGGNYTVPAELKGIVTSVLGFGQRQVARRKAAAQAAVAHAATLAPLTPSDLEARYQFPAGTAKGQSIAIAEFGGGYFASDAQAYCAKFGRPLPNIRAISVNRPAFTLAQISQLPLAQRREELSASVEVMMDVQIIAGLCPEADISVYFATFDQKGWVDLLNEVIKARPVTLSVSWGLAEDSSDWSDAARKAINERLNAAALLGITVCVASGDDGSGDQVSDGRGHIDFPSSSPFVLSVGGTMISDAGATESVWWDAPGRRTPSGGGAGGGGVSTLFPKPSWQTVKIKSINKNSIEGRINPDVAALAGKPLYDLVMLGHDAPNGGTSASAPLWAALIARLNALWPAAKQQRFIAPLLYAKTASGAIAGSVGCNDITIGNNLSKPDPGIGYPATKGFDAASGWGTPIGTTLLNVL